MHWGISYYIMATNLQCPPVVRRKQEQEADEFAAHFLMPGEELRRLKGKGFRELAEYFGVPEEMVGLRFKLCSMDK